MIAGKGSCFHVAATVLCVAPALAMLQPRPSRAQSPPWPAGAGCVHEIRPTSHVNIPPSSVWAQYADLTLTLQLRRPRIVLAFFQISDVVLQVPGGYIAARLNIDGILGNPAYTAEQERYRTVQSFWVGTLAPGSHTLKVEYRQNLTARSNPNIPPGTGADTDGRVLYAIELGCP